MVQKKFGLVHIVKSERRFRMTIAQNILLSRNASMFKQFRFRHFTAMSRCSKINFYTVSNKMPATLYNELKPVLSHIVLLYLFTLWNKWNIFVFFTYGFIQKFGFQLTNDKILHDSVENQMFFSSVLPTTIISSTTKPSWKVTTLGKTVHRHNYPIDREH